ncbi:thaumatin domain protein [Aspergillus sclerotialis]|uniref:Thaumatin domain protein n=1 Tax=Aspergillus sclerotialis TaxID=2070753 RepID=A0A3A2ZPN9_9EURO|nr:thaumatin domain protein [Aspergillus sclerotialis]
MVLLTLVTGAPLMQQVRGMPAWNGGVKIIDVDIYVRSVFLKDGGDVQTIIGHGGQYSEVWRGVGVSIKISTRDYFGDNILQFEYSANDPVIYWDVSYINLSSKSRFLEEGFAATPTSLGCAPVVCRPGDYHCSNVYFEPDDNYAIRGCQINTWVIMEIGIRSG